MIRQIRVISFNMQAGIGSHRRRHALTHGLRYVLPGRERKQTLAKIAELIAPFDLVGLQEVDAGSFRSRYAHQLEVLAEQAGFPFRHAMITRDMQPLARISLGALSRLPLLWLNAHRLPASRHGRGALEIGVRLDRTPVAVFVTHLSLSRRSRLQQLRFLARLVNRYPHAIVMGDLNCPPESLEFQLLLAHTRLRAAPALPTYPSWAPRRAIDHILVTDSLRMDDYRVLHPMASDHRPVAATISLA